MTTAIHSFVAEGVKNLPPSYFFSKLEEIKSRASPDVISLGVGDATQPVPEVVVEAMEKELKNFSSSSSFLGYGSPVGLCPLRSAISEILFEEQVSPDEIFVSDGAKSDISRLQALFSSTCVVGVQDPVYPQYVDASILANREVVYLPCTRDNGYFPDLSALEKIDILYFCAPNNPTGVMPSVEQLQYLINTAKEQQVIIVLDTAYWSFIQDPLMPKSIYHLPFAKEVVIEVGSFSKMIGFTGIRLGWSVIPKQLRFPCGRKALQDWEKVINVTYNGTSRIAQAGGMAALTPKGREQSKKLIEYYLQGTARIRECLQSLKIPFIGGEHCPYVWAQFPGQDSWEVFALILEKANVMTTPGVGFGQCGEEHLRFSGFCNHEQLDLALSSIRNFMIDS